MPEIKGSVDPLKQHQISRSFMKCLANDEDLIDKIIMECAIDALIKRLAQEISLDEIKELLEKVLYE